MALFVICSIILKHDQTDYITCATCNCNILFHPKCISFKQEDTNHLKYHTKIWFCKNCLEKPKRPNQTTS